MSRASNRQWIWAFAGGIACIAAVALACPSSWSSAGGAAAAPHAGHLPSAPAVTAAGNVGDTPPDDVAARVMRGTPTARFETFAADDAQQGAAADPAARRAELGADELRPEAMITEAAGNRYAALDAQPHPPAPQAATKR